MRRILPALLLTLALLPIPVQADDDEPGDDAPKTTDKKNASERGSKSDANSGDEDGQDDKAKSKDKNEKRSPIKKMIELKLDPFLVASRGLNIPSIGRTQELRDLLNRLEKLGKDDEVGAILMNLDGVTLAIPDIEELRAAVSEFRKSGKKVLAYLNSGDPTDFLLACEADEIAIAPTGSMSIPGLGRAFPFMRGMYQLQGVEFDVITAGRFKYPGFMNRREPSESFTVEFNEILDSWFDDYVNMIASGRKLTPEKVKKAIDIAMFNAEEAKARGLIDQIAYYDDYRDRSLRHYKFAKGDGYGVDFSDLTSLQDIFNAINKSFREAQEGYKAVGPKVAILNARGPIVDMNLGAAFSSQLIMRDEFVKNIEEIRKNKTIKAVVLRIDSPGGSGYASDIIWKKLRELDDEKPVVVSMGTVAGSGGYYIACPGRLIFAEPTTITGSIGVLAILATQASALNRMDVNITEMKRGQRSLLGAGIRDLKLEDRDFIQKMILDFYEVFLDRVSVGRKMPKDEVRKIAEGRIYTGRQALKLGLVDRLGGLKDAIASAREFANIPASAEIRLVQYPRPTSLGDLFESIMGGVSTPVQASRALQVPISPVSFDLQLRLFSRRPQSLCWMPIPEVHELLAPVGPQETIAEMLGLPASSMLRP